MTNIVIDHLKIIKGEQLSSVIFMQDYLQLDFDGNLISCYKWPKVTLNRVGHSFGDLEYRNAICDLISLEVIDVISTSVEVLIEFKRGTISFLMEGCDEVIYFTDSNKEWSYYPFQKKEGE
ncbi:hypothetical protein [Dinghuibacter silviterrae]|uniref:hypothetical protein n=1 Tax=Dinghuibacter silviterrae TaxID=1539049 RepID=UPI001063C661|nr:hypothetical protein [Dinghuibacter silviterrae]